MTQLFQMNVEGYSYTGLKRLEAGGYGEVFLARQEPGDRIVVMKVIDKHKDESVQYRFQCEVMAGKVLEGVEGVVRTLHFFESPRHYWLVTDFLEGGDLFQHMEQEGPMDEDTIKDVMRQLLRTLKQCHLAGIAHKDIKPENIVFDRNTNHVSLLDFGLCSHFDATLSDHTTDRAGSVEYSAPEIKMGRQVHFSSRCLDVWSLGATCLAALYNHIPAVTLKSMKDVYCGKRTMLDALKPTSTTIHISEQAEDFLSRATEVQPSKRATVDELLAHPFLRTKEEQNIPKARRMSL
ncbi:SNF-related serine/threonine-protein kinase [Planoprotostelium fungivorum]|uniref:SNF-related serine/threonine-protein kinase n=1 Tax=Planoprotostelium fungivorum TaxID=1890364 RepID=A0A2P6NLH4_9EUKA|nr:SNF-related serine/threonine-protein kinase [Planoprotostelium fungivorum]